MDANDVSSKLIELEDRSRWSNLRIDGIEETPIETWEYCELKYTIHIEIDVAIDYRKRKIRIVRAR